MQNQEPESHQYSQAKEDYEWALIDGEMTKITSKNANGRRCGCGCLCPCKCLCCKGGCCNGNNHFSLEDALDEWKKKQEDK